MNTEAQTGRKLAKTVLCLFVIMGALLPTPKSWIVSPRMDHWISAGIIVLFCFHIYNIWRNGEGKI